MWTHVSSQSKPRLTKDTKDTMDIIGSLINPISGSVQGGWRAFLDLIEDTPVREIFGQFGRLVDNLEGSLGITPDEEVSNSVEGSLGSS